MITIYINKTAQQIEQHSFLLDILQKFGFSHEYYAVAINREFVARSHYHSRQLMNGDHIEIVAPMQGG